MIFRISLHLHQAFVEAKYYCVESEIQFMTFFFNTYLPSLQPLKQAQIQMFRIFGKPEE